MSDQKIENLLQLSLDVPEQDRERSANLSSGFDNSSERWEVIVKYSGEDTGWQAPYEPVTKLYGGYAVFRVTREQLATLANEPMVEYIEKPKPLNFAVYNGKASSCIPPVQRNPWNLTGRGILVAIVDSGIDVFHPDFRNEDGTTRLIGLWDQTLENTGNVKRPPEGYSEGIYFSQEEINEYLQLDVSLPSVDLSGHGTHVAGIAAGNGRASRGEQRGVAYEAEILIVKLRGQRGVGDSQTAALMEGVDFCVRTAVKRGQPMALNLSYGNNYGSHSGASLLETYLDAVAGIGRTTICIGSGNEGNRARHTSLRLNPNREYQVEFIVSYGEANVGLQLWKNYADEFEIQLESPDGSRVTLSENIMGTYRYTLDNSELYVFVGEPAPHSVSQEIYFEFLPASPFRYVQNGIWKLLLTPVRVVEGGVNLWLPSGSSVDRDTGFLIPSVETTLTIPSTAFLPITVGAYDGNTGGFAPFSGQGTGCGRETFCAPLVHDFVDKPDLVAPGVNIISCAPGGGYTSRTGTSMACPFVTGSAALLMQYGIINGEDPYLYGQKVKAYLEKGAKPLNAFLSYPNASVGWGALCLRESLP